MGIETVHEWSVWRILLIAGDFLAFAAWIGVWVHTRRWPHTFFMRCIIFVVAWYRLCEGVLFFEGFTVRPWLHDVDVLLRFACPLAAVLYLFWLTHVYEVRFLARSPTERILHEENPVR